MDLIKQKIASAQRVARVSLGWLAILLATSLWYLFLLGLLLPATRTLLVTVEGSGVAVLRVLPDLRRGFFPSDGSFATLDVSKHAQLIEIPSLAKRVRLELTSARSVTFGPIAVRTRYGSVALAPTSPSSPNAVVLQLPRLAAEIPASRHFIALALALVVGFVPLANARSRARIQRWLADQVRPDALASLPGALLVWALFGFALVAIGCSADTFDLIVHSIDHPRYWPISIFDPAQPTARALLVALLFFFLADAVVCRAARGRAALVSYVGIGLASLLVTNFFFGWSRGYVEPTAGAQMYWNDAFSIRSASDFLSHFCAVQLQLQTHSRTHPPGAVLIYYALGQLIGPGVISLALGVTAFLATTLAVFGIVRPRAGDAAAAWSALLFAFVPAVQVYFISCLDAAVCACFTGALYFFLHPRPWTRAVGTASLLILSMSLTFAALFLWAVFFLYDALFCRSLWSFLTCVAPAALFYGLLYFGTGFDWLESLRIAAQRENPQGFALFHDPGSYLFTRLECVAEIALFAGPLFLAAWRLGLSRCFGRQRELAGLSTIGVGTLLSMFVSGAFKTGETARACLFIYPLLTLPLAALKEGQTALAPGEQRALFGALLGQTFLCQLFGDYYW